MEKNFVTYEQALSLNELGFKEPCFGEWRQWDGELPWLQLYQDIDGCSTDDRDYQYTTEAIAPLKSQVFKWFRDEHKLSHNLDLVDNTKEYYYDFTTFDSKNRDYDDECCIDSCRRILDKRKFNTYEEAESACIDKLIELIKNK